MRDSNAVKELVVYTLKPENRDSYKSVFSQVREMIGHYPGFKSIQTSQSAKNELTFADWVEWETMEDAMHAMKMVQEDPKFKPFMELFQEVKFADHFKPVTLN